MEGGRGAADGARGGRGGGEDMAEPLVSPLIAGALHEALQRREVLQPRLKAHGSNPNAICASGTTANASGSGFRIRRSALARYSALRSIPVNRLHNRCTIPQRTSSLTRRHRRPGRLRDHCQTVTAPVPTASPAPPRTPPVPGIVSAAPPSLSTRRTGRCP